MSGIAGTSSSKSKVIGRPQDTAKIWCNWDGTYTPAINDSFNCSSITDNSTGNFWVNFSIQMKRAPHYSCAGIARDQYYGAMISIESEELEEGRVHLLTTRPGGSGGAGAMADISVCCVIIFGD